MTTKIKKLSLGDLTEFTDLIKVFEDVFEMENFKMPNENYLVQLLKKDEFFVFVALQDNKVVGGLTAYIMHQYYSESPLVYIYDLAVNTGYQRQGIGKLLIEANNNYCCSIGVEVVMVEADDADTNALEFYRSTGATGQKVIHFDYNLNKKKIKNI